MERLEQFFAELERHGGRIDEKRMIVQCKLASRFFHARFDDTDDPLYDGDSLTEDDTYLYVSFRALSATQFPWRGMMLDFSKEGVLKKGYRLLKGQTVYSNHDTRVENWLGVVAQSKYDESVIPGINARLKLTKEFNQKVIAGIKEGAIHSASCDVVFQYEKSHPNLDDFWYLQGEEVDGQVVRVIATNIISFGELSLVWQGADSLAKRVDIQAIAGGKTPGKRNEGDETMKITRQWISNIGLEAANYGNGETIELGDAQVNVLLQDITRRVTSLSDEVKKLHGLFTSLGVEPDDATVAQLKKDVELSGHIVEDVRNEALKFAQLIEGESLPDAIKNTILLADYNQALQLRDAYRIKAEKLYPYTCPSCGSTMQRASAVIGGEADTTLNPEEYTIK